MQAVDGYILFKMYCPLRRRRHHVDDDHEEYRHEIADLEHKIHKISHKVDRTHEIDRKKVADPAVGIESQSVSMDSFIMSM